MILDATLLILTASLILLAAVYFTQGFSSGRPIETKLKFQELALRTVTCLMLVMIFLKLK
jgi:hypothetical protein